MEQLHPGLWCTAELWKVMGSPKCTHLAPEGLPDTSLKQGSAHGRLPLGKVPSGAGCSKTHLSDAAQAEQG